MTISSQDKEVERARYDERARHYLNEPSSAAVLRGARAMSAYLRAPYLAYENEIARLIGPNDHVLELGAGFGMHTEALVRTGADVVATDVAPSALALLDRELGPRYPRLRTAVADMESLPFEANSFDVVVSAGALSYGDPTVVTRNILRVLRPGGTLLCVDSLNHNPVYRFNRWRHYLSGERTKSTLVRMPTVERLRELAGQFASHRLEFFGAVTWLMPIVGVLAGDHRAAKLSDAVDSALRTRRSAFKFLLSARGRL